MAHLPKSKKQISHSQKSIPPAVKAQKRRVQDLREMDQACGFCGSIRSFLRRLVVK